MHIIDEKNRHTIAGGHKMSNMNMYRNQIKIGAVVDITLKRDQGTTRLTRGVVKRILTNKSYHSRGIKVELEDGQVGRVQAVVN